MITWETVQQGIFDGESGGDYNALFNYQNRQDGIFSNVRITDMTVDEALAFADPKGEYARYVASKNNGQIATPMGAYQIVGRTLRDAKEKLNLSGDEKLTKSLQDRIGKWIYKTQGTKAWAGYKGPKETAEGAKKMNPLQMQRMQGQQGGLMGFLRDPRTRQALTNFSRTQFGRRLNEQAGQEIAQGISAAEDNRTAQFLMTQPNGRKFAEAVLSKTLTGQQAYQAWLKESGKMGSEGNFSKEQTDTMMKFNDRLDDSYKQYNEIFNGYNLIQQAMAGIRGDGTAPEPNSDNPEDYLDPTSTGVYDLQLTIAFAKILDPESVVRSEEGEAIANSGSGMKAAIKRFSNFISGREGTLPDAVRTTIYQTARSTAERYFKKANDDYQNMKRMAQRSGFSDSDIEAVLNKPQPLTNIKPLNVPSEGSEGNGEDPRPQSAIDANISIDTWNDMNDEEKAPFL